MIVEVERSGRRPKTVVACYSVLDRVFPKCGFLDLTEGIYSGDASTSYEQAQANQQDYLLDQVCCNAGNRILDIGCGYGTLLARIGKRGAKGVGISLSPEHVRFGRSAGRDIRQLSYQELGSEWDRAFDGVIANGSAEHFVQPADALAGRADEIYRHFFQVVHRVLDPQSSARLVTTVIHFARRPDPADLLRNPFTFPRGSDAFHFAMLAGSFGGWYPVPDQLRRCAEGYFQLIDEVDGTDDYRRTSEEWLHRARQTFGSRACVRMALDLMPVVLTHPVQFATMLYALLVSESWNWQFRPPQPPTRLLRQTWAYCSDHPTGGARNTFGNRLARGSNDPVLP